MTAMGRLADGIVEHSRLVIVVLLLVIAGVGWGAQYVEQASSLSQFETGSTEGEKLEYIQSNFTARENTTTVQVILRGENVLSKESLLAQLEFQQRLRDNRTVSETLAQQRPFGIANLVATTQIRQRQAAALQARAAELQTQRQQLNATAARLSDALNRTRRLQARYDRLNRSLASGEIDNATYRQRASEIEQGFTDVRENATQGLSDNRTATFDGLFGQTRTLQAKLDGLNASLAAGEINRSTYRQRASEVQTSFEQVYAGIQKILAPDAKALQRQGERLRADRAEFQATIANGTLPSLSTQRGALESLNSSQVESILSRALSDETGGRSEAFALMPTDYAPGSTTANATMVVITQTADEDTGQGAATPRIENSQLAIQEIARGTFDSEALTFGSGIIANEIDRSMADSLQVVSPLAIAFVLIVLTIAYRDLLDIVLGVFGIAAVLVLTFGFMGWADISFNQLFVAVPVLLIGLSIDYAIHVFMRHREERASDGLGVGRSMTLALAGVGVALVLVTATTVIGFLSNLTSPVGPIRQFGVVSAVGIVAALVVFGALIPALKIELDGLLEAYGIDRRKRAFGTGGGRFSRLLAGGSTVARRAPWAVIFLTLLVSAGGAYGAVQVDTTFQNKDFIAEEPPDWMDELPASLQPGEYSMRSTLEYVNQNFLRQDSTTEFLFEGRVANPDALQRVATAQQQIADKRVTVTLSNGQPDITSPLTVIDDVRATNETFNATVAAADTDGDGVPDRNVGQVYDALFETAPDRAQQVIYREDGQYEALRITAAVRGGAKGSAITTQMDAVERAASGDGIRVTATGTPIVNEIVQDDLLQTVVESLIITLVVSFVFLMVVYRFTEGSATLGLVTLLPVAFNVSWILGTMYLLDIPFNVLTGMITSLTIGLGVAYSIHISERYSLELDRHESAWAAMETAVTGTGGALLGSAATTVGGFGVLVFAILPPLQQFGFITGLTIVYAFFASVFILPSLLAVWTRYLGPAEQLNHDSNAGVGSDTETDVPATTANGAGAGAGESDAGATPTPQLTGQGQSAYASRSVTPQYVQPGGTVTVTVTLPAITDRVVLSETPPGTDVAIDRVSPEPVSQTATADRVYVVWDRDDVTSATVEYTVSVEAAEPPGGMLAFGGDVLTPDHEVTVAGTESVPVVRDVIECILGDGAVTDRDLRDAGRHLADGTITDAQYERVYHAWLDEHASGGARSG